MEISRLSETHWEALDRNAKLIAWREAKRMGLSVEKCDRIAGAAVHAIRKTLEGWDGQPQYAEESQA